MQTVYDWVTIAIFAGLIVMFLQRSVSHAHVEGKDPIWLYLPPAVGLAVANYVGNGGYGLIAWLIIAAVCAFILLVLKPLAPTR
jgi:hypothetical protein